MPCKKPASAGRRQAIPGTNHFNKLLDQLPEKKRRSKHKFNLDMTF